MTVEEKIFERINELIEMGEKVLSTRRPPPSNTIGFDSSVDTQMGYQWFTSVQSILGRVFGEQSQHYKNFSAQGIKGITYSPVYRAQGVLKAAKDDYEHGHLFELNKLIEAELFDDFLEQSSILLNAGYYQPAAVVVGCVLEDALRKMCVKEGITLSSSPKLDSMNSELAKAGFYNKLTQKEITAIADIRNSAAHGKWDQFNKDDVERAISWVRKFLQEKYA